jgi:hypothetical protein
LSFRCCHVAKLADMHIKRGKYVRIVENNRL